MFCAQHVQNVSMRVCALQREGERKIVSKRLMWLARLLFLLFLNDYEHCGGGKKSIK